MEGTFFRVTVSDPVKSNDKFGPFICYKVTTNTDWPGFPYGDIFVNRRYSDFEWLSKEFAYQFPGSFVPALPEKQTVGRFNTEFIESRLRGLERFLNRVTSHKILSISPLFKKFLTADESEFFRMKEDAKASKKKITEVAKSFFERTMNSFTNSGKAEIEKTQEDLDIEVIQTYITAFEKQLQNVVRKADSFVSSSRAETFSLFEFGASLKAMADSETGPLAVTMQQVGNVSDSVSVSGRAYNESQTTRLLEPLEEILLLVGSVNRALKQRQDARTAYVDALTDVEVKQTAFNKTAGSAPREDKQQAVVASQAAADTAKIEFQQITARILGEFELFKNHTLSELRQILDDFSILSTERHRKGIESWGSLTPSLESNPSSSTSSSPNPSTSNPFGPSSSTSSSYSSFRDEEIVGV